MRIFDKELCIKDMKSKGLYDSEDNLLLTWIERCDGKEAVQSKDDEETYYVNALYTVTKDWTKEVE